MIIILISIALAVGVWKLQKYSAKNSHEISKNENLDFTSVYIEFNYTDGEGIPSKRRVRVLSVSESYFKAYCESRHDTRTFRYDRMGSRVSDLDTGEIFESKKWARRLKIEWCGDVF